MRICARRIFSQQKRSFLLRKGGDVYFFYTAQYYFHCRSHAGRGQKVEKASVRLYYPVTIRQTHTPVTFGRFGGEKGTKNFAQVFFGNSRPVVAYSDIAPLIFP